MFLDIIIGIGGSLIYAFLMDADITVPLVGCGILFALLPDIDFLLMLLKRRKIDRFAHEHRDILHYPLLLVPGLFLILLPFGWDFALFGSLLSLAHFVHDSVGIGWGVKWFFPFSRRLNKLRDNGRWFVSRTPEEVRHIADAHGNDDWVKQYFRFFRHRS